MDDLEPGVVVGGEDPDATHDPDGDGPRSQRAHRDDRCLSQPPHDRHHDGDGQDGKAQRQQRPTPAIAGVEVGVAPDVGDAGGPDEERPDVREAAVTRSGERGDPRMASAVWPRG